MLNGCRCADSEEPVAATILRVGLIRGPRQRKGSMQGGKNQHLKIGYRQTGHLLGGRVYFSLLAASTLVWEALLGGLGLVAAFNHRLWEGPPGSHRSCPLASGLHNMGSPYRQLTVSSNFLVLMNRPWVP